MQARLTIQINSVIILCIMNIFAFKSHRDFPIIGSGMAVSNRLFCFAKVPIL